MWTWLPSSARWLPSLPVLALGKGQTLELDAPEAVPVGAEATLLAVLVRNLVDNAIRYSPEGASVSVAVRCPVGGARPDSSKTAARA